MGNSASKEDKKMRKDRKKTVDELLKLGYDKTEISNAMGQVKQPNDVWEVSGYLEKKKQQEYEQSTSELDKIETNKQIHALSTRASQNKSFHMNTILRQLSQLSKDELMERCHQRSVSSVGTKNELIARLLEEEQFSIEKPEPTNKKQKNKSPSYKSSTSVTNED